ncbi:MAG: UDP-N-acetylmuramoyl-tripeptide--D-alanyl-D-alanine ligase, partial [Nitrospirae bacterium]|nr:UDP-N-acetylmuramoyl-tripeptide--D-alanyl-D-alanine ligase [Nitrospirota bacterium]
MFLALRGDRFDGHDFVKEALKTGGGAMINRDALCVTGSEFGSNGLRIADYDTGKTIILVDDTLFALHDLARYIRKRFKGTVVGVVGSNGKTTTKELISSILSARLRTHKTTGNLNNHIGMPLSITRAESDTGAMVLEMGTNRPGDIDELCTIGLPDIGVITNIGYEHLEGFGSLDKVRDSELEILPYVKKLILNADDSFLMEGVSGRFDGDVITFGIETDKTDLKVRDVVLSDEGTGFFICVNNECIDISSKLSGHFNVYNSLAAAAAAYAMGFNLREIKKGLESFSGVAMRFQLKRHKGVTFLNDSYNANPSSMEESLKELARRIKSGEGAGHAHKRAIAVLGDMLELGDYGADAHKRLGQWMSELPVDVFIGVGPLMSVAVSEFKGKGICAATSKDAAEELGKIIREG